MQFSFGVLVIVLAAGVASAKTRVAWIFNRPTMCKTDICLHGSFPKNRKILLLSKNSNNSCLASTGSSFKAEYEPGPFEATEIKLPKRCKAHSAQYFLAVFDRPEGKYKILALEKLTESQFLPLDKQLKRDLVFSRAWKRDIVRPEGNKDRVPYTLADFRRLETEGFHCALKNKKLDILRQKFSDGSNSGYFFAHFGDRWSTVSSTFSVGEPIVFLLDTRIFIVTRVSCQLSCGYLDNEVYEFNGRVFRLIYNNADLST